MLSTTPYYAVIFTSKLQDLSEEDLLLYAKLSDRMVELAADQDGYLGVDSARNEVGITVSYWRDLESIKKWKTNSEHTMARNQRKLFYKHYNTRIAVVEREYEFGLI
ncbi:CIC11C00000004302 [Sungouiella intermedia]|uniref:CIC11C00000004302 n=1 Tax=Sungouiella intermedia TaxID=45354 RepID=A0A1L0BJ66_9ASCO|nr:CIC11C00000004302 [[Candida] intermedia]